MKPDEKPPLGPMEPGQLPLVKAPDAIWRSIEAALDAKPEPRRTNLFAAWQWAAASVLVIRAVSWYATRPELPSWQVSRLEGSGAVDKIKVGEWLQTDGSSRARITVGNIGVVDVEPNTRVRLVAASPTEHRLTLARGEISATVALLRACFWWIRRRALRWILAAPTRSRRMNRATECCG